MNQSALEGSVLAHRWILQLILTELSGTPTGDRILALLAERAVPQDGQEDPGAVEADGSAIELALAEEVRKVAAGIPAVAGEGRD